MQPGRTVPVQSGNGKDSQFKNQYHPLGHNQNAENSGGNANLEIHMNPTQGNAVIKTKKMSGEDPQPDDGGKAGYKVVLGGGSSGASFTIDICRDGSDRESDADTGCRLTLNLYF